MIKDCAFGRENRIMIENHEKLINEIKDSVLNLSNHYSKRLPLWAVFAISFLTTICGILMTWGLSK